MTLQEMIVAKRKMIAAGWTYCGSLMHSGGATGDYGLLYVKGDRRFTLNKDTLCLAVGPFDDIKRLEVIRDKLMNRAAQFEGDYRALFADRHSMVIGWIEDIRHGWPINIEYVRSAVGEFEKMFD